MDSPSESQKTSPDVTTWVAEYGDDLFRYALLQLRDRHAAEEVVQEAFLGALKNRRSFSGRGSERAWLYSILRNKIVDFIRARAKDRKEHSTPDSHDSINASFDELGRWKGEAIDWRLPDQSISDRELWALLHDCLDRLPTGQADAFVLSAMQDLASDEVCDELEISPSNLWVRLHRARLALAKCIGVNWFGNSEEPGNAP
ncbi:MAG: sigma-70 family RNA polymerase sigma factor [Fuerstiella sp.]